MRILFVSLEGRLAGAEQSLLLLARGLCQRHDVAVACPGPGPLARGMAFWGLGHKDLPAPPIRARLSLLNMGYWLRLALSLFVAIRQARPDVLHANSFYGGPVCILLGLLTRTRVVVHARDLADFCFFTGIISACSTRLIAVSRAVKEELISQGAKAEKISIAYNGIDRKEAKYPAGRANLAQNDGNPPTIHFDCKRLRPPLAALKSQNSSSMVNSTTSGHFGLSPCQQRSRSFSPEKQSLEVPPKETEHPVDRAKSGHSHITDSEQTFTYANIGQFVPWKKQSVFLEAAMSVSQKLPQARFVVVGDDLFGRDSRYKRRLFSLVDSSEIASKVSFLGWRENMDEIWEGIDCLVHAADKEPFGRVLIEAMAHQVPVIAVDSCGPGEIIQHEETGLLVEPNDTAQLVEAMIRIAQSKCFAGRLAAKGYEHVCSSFTATETANTVNRIYSEALN